MNIGAGRVLAAAGATAVLALAGCGGDDHERGSSAPASASPSAAPSSPDAASGAANASPSTTAAADDSLATVLTRAVQEGRSAHVTLDLGRQGSAEGDMTFADGDPALQLRLSFGGRTMEVRLVDGTLYLAAPGQDGKYVKMDVGEAGSPLGTDPAQALDELRQRSGDFAKVGDGHWRSEQDGMTTDVYAGDDGYPERIEVAGGPTGSITMTFSDWGEKVTVKAPPAGDLVAGPRL